MAGRRAKGIERERAVVAATAGLIAEKGLGDLRMTDVAKRARMSVGHVTYYFPSKSDLLVRTITQSEQDFQVEVGATLGLYEDPWERFQKLIELAAAAEPRDRGWLLWFEVWANAGIDEDVADAQRELDRWWRATMREIVADGVATGRFHCEDPDRAVAILSALTDGLSIRLTLDGESISRPSLLGYVTSVAQQLLGVTD